MWLSSAGLRACTLTHIPWTSPDSRRKKEHTERLQADISALQAENGALSQLLGDMRRTGAWWRSRARLPPPPPWWLHLMWCHGTAYLFLDIFNPTCPSPTHAARCTPPLLLQACARCLRRARTASTFGCSSPRGARAGTSGRRRQKLTAAAATRRAPAAACEKCCWLVVLYSFFLFPGLCRPIHRLHTAQQRTIECHDDTVSEARFLVH